MPASAGVVRRVLPQQGFGIRHRLAAGRGMAARSLEGAQARTAPMKPIRPAPSTISGNGTSNRKIAVKAAAAIPTMTPFFSAFLPSRTTA